MKHIGIIGLGKMGLGYAHRLYTHGYTVYGFDTQMPTLPAHAQSFIHLMPDVAHMAQTVEVILLALPDHAVQATIERIAATTPARTRLVIDGGNTPFERAHTHANLLKKVKIDYVDMGVSGGIEGKDRGYCLMIGSDPEHLPELEPLCHALACPGGWARVGGIGMGHYVKMVHNAIEYVILQAYAESALLLQAAPEKLPLGTILELWQHGSLLHARLLEYVAQAAQRPDDLLRNTGTIPVSPFVQDLLSYGQKQGLNLDALQAAIMTRQTTHEGHTHTGTQLIAAARHLFGGHPLDPA